MTIGRLGSISLDCADPAPLAQFWATVTGGEVAFSSDDFVAVRLPGGMWLSTVRIADYRPPGWPDDGGVKQMHLDVAVDDLDTAERAALDAGATGVEHQPSPDKWRVLLDPAGHPFCLSSQIPD